MSVPDEPSFSLVHDLVTERARRAGETPAVLWQGGSTTYAELERRAAEIANGLSARLEGLEPLVAIALTKSPDMIASVLAVLRSGGAYLPLDPDLLAGNAGRVLADAEPDLILTEDRFRFAPAFHGRETETAESMALPVRLHTAARPRPRPANAAYVTYTSGSTGEPKGVVMEHRAVTALTAWQMRRSAAREGWRTAQFAPLSFDVSCQEIFPTLCSGGTLVLVPDATRRDPDALWRFVDEQRIERLFLPYVALHYLALAAEKSARVPARLAEITSSGERLQITPAIRTLFERMTGCLLDNHYGPAETHVATAFRLRGPVSGWPQLPPIGRGVDHSFVRVLDGEGLATAAGSPGEIYVGGAGLARGYLRNEAGTEERFVYVPDAAGIPERLYRTGDLGRWLPDGNLEFLGRVDDQVKIRGQRVQLGAVEATLAEHPEVRVAAAAVHERGAADRRLVAFVVARERPPGAPAGDLRDSLRRFLRARLVAEAVPTGLHLVEALPKTSSGKVDRRRLLADLEATGDAAETGGGAEEILAGLWRELLGADRVDRDDNFFELGGHSLLAFRLVSELESRFGLKLSVAKLFERPTIAQLADEIREPEKSAAPRRHAPSVATGPRSRHQPFALTPMQRAYWIGRQDTFELGRVSAHIYVEMDLPELDVTRLEAALHELIAHHDMLRAVTTEDGEQRVLAKVPPYEIATEDLRALEPEAVDARLSRTREALSHQVLPSHRWPLFEIRASLLPAGATRLHCSYDLLIGDLRSLLAMSRQLRRLYADESAELEPVGLTFRDYVLATSSESAATGRDRARRYWIERLESLPPPPELPLLGQPARSFRPRFARLSGALDPAGWHGLKAMAAGHGLTPGAVALTLYAAVLARWSRRGAFTLNLPIMNRLPVHDDVDAVVGDFTSVSLLAVDCDAHASLQALALAIQRQLWDDLAHREYSGVELMGELSRRRGSIVGGAMPVVFTSTMHLDMTAEESTILGWSPLSVHSRVQTPQVWLDHQVGEVEGAFHYNWDYVLGLFPDGVIEDMFAAYEELLAELARNPDAWTSDVERDLLRPAHRRLIAEANRTAAPVPAGLLHAPFSGVAAEHPERVAVRSGDSTLSYGELRRRASEVAAELVASHDGRDDALVGVYMDKGWQQVVAVLGILGAGRAYLPLDPGLPPERCLLLAQSAGVRTVLAQPHLQGAVNWPAGIEVRPIEGTARSPRDLLETWPDASPDDLAYVIYTSGSTGMPKGVMVEHRSALNTVVDVNRRFSVGPGDAVLGLSALGFDLSVYDVFGSLAAGATLVLPRPDELRDPAALSRLMREEGVSIWNSVPAHMDLLLEHVEGTGGALPAGLRLVLLSGDWIPLGMADRIRALGGEVEVISLGGATEASIWSVLHRMDGTQADWKSVPYGRPMRNQRAYVLDGAMRHRPLWVAGDLYLAGEGLARGYLDDERRTDAGFVRDASTGERLYRTGDLARWRPEGELELLGREDNQVKIQGYRIELGEIEIALAECDGVARSVVVAVGDRHGSKQLVAFVVAEAAPPGGRPAPEIPSEHLAGLLRERLPRFMVPSRFLTVDALPVTANGKIDRRALEAAAVSPRAPAKLEAAAGAGSTALERALIAVFEQVLGVEGVDPERNFFELGASSLHLVRAQRLLRDRGIDADVVEFFDHPTVRALAGRVASRSADVAAVSMAGER